MRKSLLVFLCSLSIAHAGIKVGDTTIDSTAVVVRGTNLTTEISTTSGEATGSVTVHSDVSSAGSGAIITAGERGTITTNIAKLNTANTFTGAADFAQRPTVGTQEVAYVSQLGSGGGGATTNDVATQWPFLDYQVDTNGTLQSNIDAKSDTNDVAAQWPLLDYQVATNANFQSQLDNKLEQLGTGEQSTNSALLTCTTSPSLSEGVFLRVPLNTNFVTQIGGWDFGGFLDAADNRVLFSSSGPGKYTGFLMASFGGANDIEDVSLQAYKTDGTTTNSFWLTSYAHSGAATYSPTIQYPFSLDITSAVQSIWFDIRVTGTSGDETINGPRTGIYIEKVSTPQPQPDAGFDILMTSTNSGQVVAANTTTKPDFDNVLRDDQSGWSLANDEYTVQDGTAGRWSGVMQVEMFNVAAGNELSIQGYHASGSVTSRFVFTFHDSPSGFPSYAIPWERSLSVGDRVWMTVRHNDTDGGTETLYGEDANYRTRMTGNLLKSE